MRGCQVPWTGCVGVFAQSGRWCSLGSIEVWEDSPGGARVVLKSSLLHLHKGLTVQHPLRSCGVMCITALDSLIPVIVLALTMILS